MAFVEDPFSRSTFTQAYGRSIALLMERLDLYAVIACIMFLPFLMIQASFTIQPDLTKATPEDPYGLGPEFQQQVQSKMALFWAEMAFNTVVGVIGQAAISIAVARMYLKSYPELVVTLKAGASHFCNLFCCSLLVGCLEAVVLSVAMAIIFMCWFTGYTVFKIVAVLLSIAIAIGLVFLLVSLTIVTPVIALERQGPVEGLKRAWSLSHDNRCYIFCTSFCLTIAFAILNSIMSAILFDGFFGLLLKQLPFLFSFPLSSILTTVVYLNIRIEREGLNADVLSREMDGNNSGDYSAVLIADDIEEAKSMLKDEKGDGSIGEKGEVL